MRWPFKRTTDPDLTRTDAEPDLTGLNVWPQAQAFYHSLHGHGFSPHLINRVWVANRCIQLNSQQIASMPLKFVGTSQPAWVTNPDPSWYPNGINDAVFAAVRSMYGWGDAFLYISGRYANGLPSAWTVLDPAPISVELVNGMRLFKSSGKPLRNEDVVQISLNPDGSLRGKSALYAFGSFLHGSLSSAQLSRQVMGENPTPHSVLKSQRKLTQDQADLIQARWAEASASRRGLPAILPPDLDFQQLAFSPRDLMLLEGQEFNARMIATAFGIPAFLLNVPLEGGLTYQNPAMLFDMWWRTELRPAAKRVSDALSAQMLPRGSSVHFDARDVLAPSLPDLHKIWSEALTAEAVTVDEYRQAVLQIGPQAAGASAIDELLQPASAGASPADQPSSEVVALRPNVWSTG